MRAGLQAFERGLADVARKHFEHVVELDPTHARAALSLGTVLLQLGAPDRALSHLERSAQALRHDAHAIDNLAQAYYALERWDDARAAFEQASKLAPQDPRFAMGAANSAARQTRFEDAASILVSLTRTYPNAALVWFNLGNVPRDQGRLDEPMAASRRRSGSIRVYSRRTTAAAAYCMRWRIKRV